MCTPVQKHIAVVIAELQKEVPDPDGESIRPRAIAFTNNGLLNALSI